jgi:hypothetical protein
MYHDRQAVKARLSSQPTEHVQPRELRKALIQNQQIGKRIEPALGEWILPSKVSTRLFAVSDPQHLAYGPQLLEGAAQ